MLAEWEQSRLYQRIQQARAGAPTYVLHDGPPYPTGTIHLGTGLNKILKDMVVKSKTHGRLSRAVRSRLGLPRTADRDAGGKRIGREEGQASRPAEFRRMCREFAAALTWISIGAISSAWVFSGSGKSRI